MLISKGHAQSILRGISAAVLLAVASALHAQQPKVQKKNGHVSPLMATITGQSGSKREVMILGVGNAYAYRTHDFIAKTDDGSSDVTIWLDTISAISNTTNEDFSIVLKDGTRRHLLWNGTDCTQPRVPALSPLTDCAFLYLFNPDGGPERVNMEKINSVKFLKAARKDSAGNAMFDSWKYSPYTGEKLPEN